MVGFEADVALNCLLELLNGHDLRHPVMQQLLKQKQLLHIVGVLGVSGVSELAVDHSNRRRLSHFNLFYFSPTYMSQRADEPLVA